MSEKTVTTTIEILGKLYPIRAAESEVPALIKAAEYLNNKMNEVQESGKAINLERIAIITALNITYQFLQQDSQQNGLIDKINERIHSLQEKLDNAVRKPKQTDLLYSME